MRPTAKTATRRVLCNGTFDPLHVGHVLHLIEAKRLGTELVVGLTSDASVRKEKGSSRPMFSQAHRALMLKSLRCVDDVLVVDSALEALELLMPDVFVKGRDYQDIAPDLRQFCDRHEIEVVFTKARKWSATDIGNALREGQ